MPPPENITAKVKCQAAWVRLKNHEPDQSALREMLVDHWFARCEDLLKLRDAKPWPLDPLA